MGSIYFNSSGSGSLSGTFDIGLSAINATRVALQTIGHNIANVNTEGYSRQQVLFGARLPQPTPIGSIGRGVDALKIEALRDRFIEAQLAYESAEAGRLNTMDSLLERIEAIYNPNNALGLSDATDNFFGGFQDLAGNPESIAQREAMLETADGLASASRHVIDQLNGVKHSINDQVRASVSQINTLLEEIASLNVKLSGSEALGVTLEDVMDQRNLKYRELNEMIGVQSFTDENGNLTITTGNGTPLVIGNQYATLTTEANTLDPNALDVASRFNGVAYNITNQVRGGTLGALLETRDQIIADAISNQRLFAAILADAVNIEHHQGTDLNGNAGGDFFNSPFSVFDSSNGANVLNVVQVGNNVNYEINYSVLPNATSGVNVTDINLDTANLDLLTKHNYRIEFAGAAGDYSIVDIATQRTVASGNLPGAGTITFEGLSVDFDGQPNPGDYYDLRFDGRTGMTGDVYRIEFTNATDYEIYNVTDRNTIPVATGTLGADNMIFFDGLAVQLDGGALAAGDSFTVDYAGLAVNPNLDAEEIAASGSLPGLPEPGDTENALRLANLGLDTYGGLGGRSFSFFQGSQISTIGSEKASTALMKQSQDTFIASLEMQRESVSGVSLDEEAANLIQYQQSYSAAARYLSQVNELLDFLLNILGR